jgi:hypothetical protein
MLGALEAPEGALDTSVGALATDLTVRELITLASSRILCDTVRSHVMTLLCETTVPSSK